jgi:DNA gyrase/topoisomerase IV subunit A
VERRDLPGRISEALRALATVEELRGNREQIVVSEIPYQVNKARLIEQIAELVKDGKLEGISALRDESDRDGMRIVIELKRDAIPRVVLNQLYKHTQMQSTFGVIMLALVPDQTTGRLVPRVLPLRDALDHYIQYRHNVIVRRTQFELDKALEREHILEGLKIAVDNIDEVVELIKTSPDSPTALRNTRIGRSRLPPADSVPVACPASSGPPSRATSASRSSVRSRSRDSSGPPAASTAPSWAWVVFTEPGPRRGWR